MRDRTQPDFHLATEVATLEALKGLHLAAYSRVYLGNPFCIEFRGNLLAAADNLSEAIRLVNDAGACPIVSLVAMPASDQLRLVDELIEVSIAAGTGGFEAHSVGVLHRLSERQDVHGLTVVAGGFSNIYTRRTAVLYAEKGATLLVPNYELPWEAIESMTMASPVPFEILVHGKIPLGLSDSCLLVERSGDLGTKCPDSCLSDLWLEFHKWSLRSFGKLTSSGKDLCLLPEVPFFWSKGARDFRVAGLTEKSETLNEIGRTYRRVLDSLRKRSVVSAAIPDDMTKTSRYGLCNGYLYGRSGCDWVERHLQAT